jgi:hypothetical protein
MNHLPALGQSIVVFCFGVEALGFVFVLFQRNLEVNMCADSTSVQALTQMTD